jgi:excisionase family DNA binding protein
MSEQADELLTVADVAAVLNLNQQTVRTWIDQVKLPALTSVGEFAFVAPTSTLCLRPA